MRVQSGLVVTFLLLSMWAPLDAQSAPSDQAGGSQLKIGGRIPELSGVDQFGTHQNFESLKGPNGLVLLFFRSADW